jgi:hypothetical protein
VVQTTPFVGGVYRALIIGNDSYRDPQRRWPSLETAVSDARAVSRLLRRHYGFSDVEVLENATRRDILRALERLSKRSLPNDSVLVYYAGHGFLDDYFSAQFHHTRRADNHRLAGAAHAAYFRFLFQRHPAEARYPQYFQRKR